MVILRRRTPNYLAKAWPRLALLGLYLAVNGFLFWNGVQRYAEAGANVYIQIARGSAACINLNGALILVPMMRHSLTWLRKTLTNANLPLDQMDEFHTLVGHALLGFGVVHMVAHILNYSTLPAPITDNLVGTKVGLTGVFLIFILMGMWSTALVRRRSGGHFEVFSVVHVFAVAWFILALLHGPGFWRWVALPVLGYGIDRLLRLWKARQAYEVIDADSDGLSVVALAMPRPRGFGYMPGDYVKLRFPSVSRFKWHPFSITSSPEDMAALTVHVRRAGDWTTSVHKFFSDSQSRTTDKLVVNLDGPYGGRSSRALHSKYAVMIGMGIGITPFASILGTILNRYRNREALILQRVIFYWVFRYERELWWFAQLLREIEAEHIDWIDVNVHVTRASTGVKPSTPTNSSALRESGTTPFDRRKARVKFGRPQWESIFAEIAKSYPAGEVDVYFCGPPELSKELQQLSRKCGFNYAKEEF